MVTMGELLQCQAPTCQEDGTEYLAGVVRAGDQRVRVSVAVCPVHALPLIAGGLSYLPRVGDA